MCARPGGPAPHRRTVRCLTGRYNNNTNNNDNNNNNNNNACKTPGARASSAHGTVPHR